MGIFILLLCFLPGMLLGRREKLHVLVTFYLKKETLPVVLCQSFFISFFLVYDELSTIEIVRVVGNFATQ